MRWIETASGSYWPRAPLKRDRWSHAVAQRHSLGCYLPAPAMRLSPYPRLPKGKGENS